MTNEDCPQCNGTGTIADARADYAPPSLIAILDWVRTQDGILRASVHKDANSRTMLVWRLARFYRGIEERLPADAMEACVDDPYIDDLHEMARVVAERSYSSYPHSRQERFRRWFEGREAPEQVLAYKPS